MREEILKKLELHPATYLHAEWPRQIIGAALMVILVFVVETLDFRYLTYPHGPFAQSQRTDVSLRLGALPVAALFSLSGIWFGVWGIVAVSIGSAISPGPTIPVGYFFVSLFAASISAMAFRYFKVDPRLKTAKDVLVFVLFGILLPSLSSALIGSTIMYMSLYPDSLHFIRNRVLPLWFQSSLIWSTILGFPLILLGSRILFKAKAYCKGWFS